MITMQLEFLRPPSELINVPNMHLVNCGVEESLSTRTVWWHIAFKHRSLCYLYDMLVNKTASDRTTDWSEAGMRSRRRRVDSLSK